MNDSESLQHSLATMGLVELAIAFAAIAGYALVLNPLLGMRGRVRAAGAAVAAAIAFVLMADPWVNGFIMVVLAVAGVGLFTALVWAVSAACGLTRSVPASDGESPASSDEALGVEATDRASAAAKTSANDSTTSIPPRGTPGPPVHSG